MTLETLKHISLQPLFPLTIALSDRFGPLFTSILIDDVN